MRRETKGTRKTLAVDEIMTFDQTKQAHDPDPRPFKIYRNNKGWPRWYQPWLEAYWIISGRWSLHCAWQEGYDHGRRMEYQRTVINGGR